MKKEKLVFFLVFLSFFTMLWHLGSWGVLETSEARYAEISREILTTHDWFMPRLMGIFHFDKPLLTYWMTALGMKIFGVDAFGVRFFLQIAFFIQMILVYSITKLLFKDTQKAFYAALLYLGIPLVIISVRNLTTDAYLNTFELLSVFFLIKYYLKRKPVWLYLFFLGLAMALFTKGPVGLIIPLLLIYPVRKIFHINDSRNQVHVGLGIVLMLVLGSSWFIYLMVQSPRFYHFFLGEQLIDRMFKASTLHRAKPFWYYFLFFPLTTLPAFFLLPETAVKSIKHAHKTVSLLLLYWFAIPFVFFSVSSSKLVLYVLPIAPVIAITGGWFIHEKPWNELKKYFYLFWGFYALVFVALILLFSNIFPQFTIRGSASVWFFLLLGIVLLMVLWVKKSKLSMALLSLVLPLSVVPVSTQIFGQMEAEIHGMKPVATFLKKEDLSQRKIIVWDERLPSLSFELQKGLYSVYYQDFLLKRHTEFQKNDHWKKQLINVHIPAEQQYLKNLISSPSVFIVKENELPEKYHFLLSRYSRKKQIGPWKIYF